MLPVSDPGASLRGIEIKFHPAKRGIFMSGTIVGVGVKVTVVGLPVIVLVGPCVVGDVVTFVVGVDVGAVVDVVIGVVVGEVVGGAVVEVGLPVVVLVGVGVVEKVVGDVVGAVVGTVVEVVGGVAGNVRSIDWTDPDWNGTV